MKRFYRPDQLDVTIDAIGKDTNLRFIYDQEHLHRYKLSVDPLAYDSKVKTVGAVLDILRFNWGMTVLVSEDGYGIFTGISCVKRTIKVAQGSLPF